MSDWLHNLPLAWMALVVFAFTSVVVVAIYGVVAALAVGERSRSFKAVSPSLLPALGSLFAFFVAFTAVQVWSDREHAAATVNREASALRSVVILAAALPGEAATRLPALVGRYIEDAATQEWPMMARGSATMGTIPGPLAEALQLTLRQVPGAQGNETAQRAIVAALENALDARRQRIFISRSEVNVVKWLCLFLQAACALIAIAVVHSGNRLAALLSMGVFATGAAACVLLILAHDRPFTGRVSIGPEPLLQVIPDR